MEGIFFTAPVSGTVSEIRRGAKRSIAEVIITADDKNEYKSFKKASVGSLSKEEILELNNKETINFTALRSPIPNFGGREPLDIDNEDSYDENEDNPQYSLIFDAWDAQFDKQYQEWNNFNPANSDELKLFKDCLRYANKLGDLTQSKFENNFNDYFENAKQNIEKWAGIGIVAK